MKFCPKCGGLLVPKSLKTLECPNCKTKVRTDGFVIKEKLATKSKKTKKSRGKPIGIEDTVATTELECPKCKNKEAYWWTIQTRAADEPETQFYRCTKCRYTWREYS